MSLPILGQLLTKTANISIGYFLIPIESIAEPLLQPFHIPYRPFDAWTTTNFEYGINIHHGTENDGSRHTIPFFQLLLNPTV